MEPLVRAYPSAVEVEGDGRTVVGLLAPYNERAEVDDGFGPYLETFLPGCFTRACKGRPEYLRVQLEHNGHWVGRGSMWRDTSRGLEAELRLDDTEAGREAAYKIRDGQTPGLSIAFVPGKHSRVLVDGKWNVKRETIRALHHVALCPVPAYQGAVVEAIRSRSADRVAYWEQWTERVKRV
jgi:HK97 family phage prohead protease